MATENELRERLQRLAGSFAPDVSNIAQVSAVNESESTCVLVDDDGQEYFDVRLRPVTGQNKSYLQIPEIGSFVLSVRIESSDEWMVIACETIAKVQIIIGGESIMTLTNDLIDLIRQMVFVTPAGNTTLLVNDAAFVAFKQRLNAIIF